MDDVDIALVLALDCSASVTYDEFGLMAGGLADALRQPAIVSAFLAGPNAATICTLLLFSGIGEQETMIEWTRLDCPADVWAFADQVENVPRVLRAGLTAVGELLLAAESLMELAPSSATRRIVDIVADGRSNDGTPPGPVRDRLVASGITINGLCILHEEPDLLNYFAEQVIGGPGAFALTCPDFPAFSQAIARKLMREVTA